MKKFKNICFITILVLLVFTGFNVCQINAQTKSVEKFHAIWDAFHTARMTLTASGGTKFTSASYKEELSVRETEFRKKSGAKIKDEGRTAYISYIFYATCTDKIGQKHVYEDPTTLEVHWSNPNYQSVTETK